MRSSPVRFWPSFASGALTVAGVYTALLIFDYVIVPLMPDAKNV